MREARQRNESATRDAAAAALSGALLVWWERRSAVAEVERLRTLRGAGHREAAATCIQAAVRVRRCCVYLPYWYKSRVEILHREAAATRIQAVVRVRRSSPNASALLEP